MNESQKLLVTLGAFGGAAFLLLLLLGGQAYVIGIGPLAGEESYSTLIAAKQAARAVSEAKAKQRPEFESKLDELKALQTDAEELMPTTSQPGDLLGDIQTKAKDSLVEIKSIKPETNRAAAGGRGAVVDNFDTDVYKLDISGSFSQIAQFLNYMEMFSVPGEGGKQRKRLFVVRNFSLETEGDGMGGGDLKAKIDLCSYRYKAPPAKAAK